MQLRRSFQAMALMVMLLAGCGDSDPTLSEVIPPSDLTVASLNVLHGINCPPATRQCRLADRIDLLFQWIVREGCPDVVTLQEVSTRVADLVRPRLATVCPFVYEAAYFPTTLRVDDEMLLSRYPIQHAQVEMLYGGFRSVLWGRIDHPLGQVDVFSTHLASSSDFAQDPCIDGCPSECVSAGASNRRDCQAVQLRLFVTAKHGGAAPAVISGDFNEIPGSFVYRQFVERGWVDTHLAAGNGECNASTGENCTAGRQDDALGELESPARNQRQRIDFIFVLPPAASFPCRTRLDSATDSDGDGVATGLFTGVPNPFAASCGAAPLPICWPSDHIGAQLDLNYAC